MSETEADRAFYSAAESAFMRRRGTPFLLSPRDFALLREWRALGVPLEAVAQGIDDAFSKREERGAMGKINSLAYCRDAVLSAWERRAETAVGAGKGRAEAPPDAAKAIAALEASLAAVAGSRADLAEPLESARRSLERLAEGKRSVEEIEASLARLDRRLASALIEALPAAERDALEAAVTERLERAGARMDAEAADRTRRALTRRALRERLDLPRLTLLP
jgi:hypothetical protein